MKRLFIAIKKNDLETVKTLIEEGADVNVRDGFGSIPLHYAAFHNYLEIVKYLVEKWSNVKQLATL